MTRTALCRRLLLLILLLSVVGGGSSVWAQKARIASLFLELPDTIVPHLDRPTKERLLEAYTLRLTGRTPEPVRNLFGGRSVVESLSDTRIVVRLDENSLLDLKLLRSARRNAPILALAFTHLRVPEVSVTAFYDTAQGWRQIPTSSLITLPRPEDFLLPGVSPGDIEVTNALVERGLWLYSAAFEDDTERLIFRPTTFRDALAAERYPGLPSKLVGELVYVRRHATFQKLK